VNVVSCQVEVCATGRSGGALPNMACLSVMVELREGGLVLLRLLGYKNIAA
jgi:hypothetical protein